MLNLLIKTTKPQQFLSFCVNPTVYMTTEFVNKTVLLYRIQFSTVCWVDGCFGTFVNFDELADLLFHCQNNNFRKIKVMATKTLYGALKSCYFQIL